MKKVNLKLLFKPKVFWPSSIIILLIVSSTLYIFKEKEKVLRISIQKQLTKTVEEKKVVENILAGTISAKKLVEEELVAEKERTLALQKEVKEKKHQIEVTLDKLKKEIITRREAEGRLLMVMKEKSILEIKLRELTKAPKIIELEKIVVEPVPTPVSVGKILKVYKEFAFVVVDLGKVNNLELGDVLAVYRNEEFVGKVLVEKVENEMSAAAILSDRRDFEFRENDVVKKF